jgi:hypothetical protein
MTDQGSDNYGSKIKKSTNQKIYTSGVAGSNFSGGESSSFTSSSTHGTGSPSLGGTVPPQSQKITSTDEFVQLAVASAAAKVDSLFNEKVVFLDQAERRVKKMLDESTKLMASIQAGLESSKKLTEKSLQTQQELQEEVRSIKGNAISALSIFVSFFAFITVAINIFSKAESVVSASVLVLIFWCLLIGFNIIISIQFKTVGSSKSLWASLLFVIFVSVSSICVMFFFSPELRGVKYVFKFFV